ncbi:MmgE/PrpD family protein [Novosphingobium sp. FSY-8]|uniref:MmgE/PrpD family protein n=1 Tax=Novosphingobium ovatum TaxID=1908523 RepID=A0ABW9XBY3_9SPHN|nr:MmgE/PrpD family protein [Novosphingobium ovatum]NBC36044.1 MmgE/PrpD family protein [Novosphingobium ovatum]
MRGVSDVVAAHVAATRFADLPPGAVAAARHVLLDALGVMLGASGMSAESAAFVRVAVGNGPGPCAVLGTGLRAAAPMAALANGGFAHALDYEDAFDRAPGHPNASLVPALIALAQAEGAAGRPVDGRRFLTALAVGGDLSCRMGLALRRQMEAGGWYPPPILAGMGAAAGAAALLGLDAGAVRDALSLMMCQNVIPGEIKYSQGTVIRAVREGFPAQAAVLSAQLAREGVAGFEQPIEGRSGFYAVFAGGQFDADDLTGDLGARYWIDELTYKRWPSCRGTHPFIEMALALRGQIGAAAVTAVAVGIDDVQTMLTEPLPRKQAPATAIDAKFSIPFTTALALVRGRVGLDDFGPDSLADPDVLAMAARVTPVQATGAGWQRGSGGRLVFNLSDGRVLTAEQADAAGSPERPLGQAALVAKFIDCAGRAAVPVGDPAALAGAILNLQDCADVGALLAV